MLNANSLGTQLANSTSGSLQKWFNTLANYLIANTEFNYYWIAFDVDKKPDTMINPVAKFTVLSFTARAFTSMQDFCAIIQEGCAAGMVNITGFNTTPVPFAISTILNLQVGQKCFPDEHIYKAQQIINWIKSWKITTPISGAHSSYTGSGAHKSTT